LFRAGQGGRKSGKRRAYECGEVLADAAVGVAEPDVVAEVVHVQHQAPHAVLHDTEKKNVTAKPAEILFGSGGLNFSTHRIKIVLLFRSKICLNFFYTDEC
jgi:hypothetical protein